MRVLLFTPLTIQVEAAKQLGFHVTSIWHRYDGPNFFEKIIADVKRLSDEFIEANLVEDKNWINRVADIFESYPETILIPGVPDEFLPAFLLAAGRAGRLPNPLSVYDVFRDKSRLRRLLSDDAALRVFHRSIESKEQLTSILNAERPSILKPATSSGSKDIAMIATADDAHAAFEKWSSSREPLKLVLEEYLDGTQFSVEAISREGHHAVLGITEKFPVLPPNYVENGGVFPAQVTESLERDIRSTVLAFLDKSGFRTGPTHTEVIATKRGIKIVESNIRMGGLIPFLIEGAHGIDANAFLIEFVSGKKTAYVPVKQNVAVLGIIHLGTGEVLDGIRGLEAVRALPYVIKMNIWARSGEVLRSPVNNEQRHGYVVVSGADLSEAMSRLESVKDRIQPIYRRKLCRTPEKSSI